MGSGGCLPFPTLSMIPFGERPFPNDVVIDVVEFGLAGVVVQVGRVVSVQRQQHRQRVVHKVIGIVHKRSLAFAAAMAVEVECDVSVAGLAEGRGQVRVHGT